MPFIFWTNGIYRFVLQVDDFINQTVIIYEENFIHVNVHVLAWHPTGADGTDENS